LNAFHTTHANEKLQVNFETGEREIGLGDGVQRYLLKPLRELRGEGVGTDTVDLQNEVYMPLFLTIKENIAQFYTKVMPSLTDGAVSLMLDQLSRCGDDSPADASSAERPTTVPEYERLLALKRPRQAT
jgi:hypothetical protein